MFENGNQFYSGDNLLLALQEDYLRESSQTFSDGDADSSKTNDNQKIMDELVSVKGLAESYNNEFDSLKDRLMRLRALILRLISL